jgi:hypothetical protein
MTAVDVPDVVHNDRMGFSCTAPTDKNMPDRTNVIVSSHLAARFTIACARRRQRSQESIFWLKLARLLKNLQFWDHTLSKRQRAHSFEFSYILAFSGLFSTMSFPRFSSGRYTQLLSSFVTILMYVLRISPSRRWDVRLPATFGS